MKKIKQRGTKSTVCELDIISLLRFLLQRNCFPPSPIPFQLPQIFFFKFSIIPPIQHLRYKLPQQSPLLKSLSSTISIFSCFLISAFILPSNSFKASPAFFRFSFLSYVSPFTMNPFYHTMYFSTPLIFFLFKILSTSHSLAPSTSIGFPSSFFCPFTCSLYHTIQLTFTTGCILIEVGSYSLTAFDETTSSISYGPTYFSVNFLTGLSLNTKSLVLSKTLSPFFQSSVSLLFLSAYHFISSCIFLNAAPASLCTFFIFSTNFVTLSTFSFFLISPLTLNSLPQFAINGNTLVAV